LVNNFSVMVPRSCRGARKVQNINKNSERRDYSGSRRGAP
jgi:hypothetical protein